MRFSNQNLIATVVFAFVAMASCDSCAALQQGQSFGAGRVQGGNAGSSLNPLRAAPLSDLRSGRIDPKVKWAEQAPAVPATRRVVHPPSSRIAAKPAADLQPSFFDQDHSSGATFICQASDLQTSLMSAAQLKRWMQSVPSRAEPSQATRINHWSNVSESQVRLASFASPVTAEPTRSQQQIEDFKARLDEVKVRFEAKQKQLAADKSSEDDGSKDELNTLSSLADKWIGKAASDWKKLDSDTKAKEAFERNFKKQEKDLAIQKEKFAALEKEQRRAAEAEKETAELKQPIKPEPFPAELGEAIDKLQKKLKENQASLQADIEIHNEVRDEISDRDRRVTAIPETLRENAKEKNETKKQIEELNDEGDLDLRGSLQKLQFDAKLLSLEITEELLELEGTRQEQLGQILPLKLEELTLKIRLREHDLAVWSDRSESYRNKENEKRLLAAKKVLEDLSLPKLKELAEYNEGLAEQQNDLVKITDELKSELNNVRQLQQELDESHQRILTQMFTLGPTASGIRLVEHRRSLISTGKSQNRLLEVAELLQSKLTKKLELQERLDQLVLEDSFKLDVLAAVDQQVPRQLLLSKQADKMELKERLNQLPLEDSFKQDLLAAVEQMPQQMAIDKANELLKARNEMAVEVANGLLETQKNYIADLVDVYKENIDNLSALETAHKALIAKVQEVKAFSDKNALWVRSAKPIEFNDLKLCLSGLKSVLVSGQWRAVVEQASVNFNKHPYHAGLLALVIGSLLVVRRRLRWSHE